MSSVLERGETVTSRSRTRGSRVLVLGAVAFTLVLLGWVVYDLRRSSGWTLYPVDFGVYRDGGLIVRHISPPYNPSLADPLYNWSHTALLSFTYTPFAAIAFAVVSFVPPFLDSRLEELVNLLALVAATWLTMRALGWTSRRILWGGALLGAAAGLLTEPVFRTIYLGQINIVLMLMIIWDLTQPDTRRSRWWKGFLTGVAAGVKLVPLVFIPYLLLTRKFRQAFMTIAGFAFTVVVGFAVVPHPSSDFWFNGLFIQDGRTGFPGWGGNQSLRGMVTRLAGSIDAGTVPWVVTAVVVGVAGLVAAALLHRAGHEMLGLLTAALVGLLDSPISWDHHWVWVVPGMMAAGHYAVTWWQSRRRAVLSSASRAFADAAAVGAFSIEAFSEDADSGDAGSGDVGSGDRASRDALSRDTVSGGRVPRGAASERSASAGASSGGAASAGSASGGTASGGTASAGAASWGTASGGTASRGAVSVGAALAGAASGGGVPGDMSRDAAFGGSAIRRGRALVLALSCGAVAVAGLLIFAPWPGRLWGAPVTGPGSFTWGLIWSAPNSRVVTFMQQGDQSWYLEYHWHFLQILAGNAYVLAGLCALFILCAAALKTTRRPAPPAD